jgi:ribosomal protein S27E
MTILLRVCRTCAKLIIIYSDPSPENYVGRTIRMNCPDCGSWQVWKEENEVSVK